jgi:UDP-glucuronate 4-epimerase
MFRDFTYVEDLVRGIRLLIDAAPVRVESASEIEDGDSLSPAAPYRVVNVGNSDKVRLLDFVEAIEDALGKKANRNYMKMQMGDVPATWANAELLQRLTGYRPATDFRDGVNSFVEWYLEYFDK